MVMLGGGEAYVYVYMRTYTHVYVSSGGGRLIKC